MSDQKSPELTFNSGECQEVEDEKDVELDEYFHDGQVFGFAMY